MAPTIPFTEEDDISVFDWNKAQFLGKGSYGKVFLGTPTKPDLGFVAIKVAPLWQKTSSLIKEKVVLEQFIGCPEIVQYIGDAVTIKRDDHLVYNLILEYAAGGTLADIIKKQKKLQEEDAKQYLRMILRGLSCIHAKSFVHADLKPTNILAFPLKDGRMQLKIADFGLARIYYKKEERDFYWKNNKMKFVGTTEYMSPESVVGNIDPSLDIWSLGCIFLNMITGECVWNDCLTYEQLITKLVYEGETPTIPEELSDLGKDFLQKCFERNYEERWSVDRLFRHPYLVQENKITNNINFNSLLDYCLNFLDVFSLEL
ncbi:mitogen-activated protein kinase kinase kinase 17-like [Momordica charantia]|uniref:Mitogen-activated protein kinase kinase kinase 17-like n=1 Tax=Momordica charantia TaxID=3673 RepID=A0A6J1BRL7_MOMCH|nr:mitogen-activated protein kinase kinase kinase 17-like [Momordica charantia]